MTTQLPENLPDGIEVPFAPDSATGTFPVNIPIAASKGDRFKPQIRNVDGLDDMDITHMSMGPS